MKPLQVWLPLLDCALADPASERDSKRAFESWRGELRVWLLPEIKAAAHWRQGNFNEVAVPSEDFNAIDVYHVGRNGHVIGPPKRFPNSTVDGLLDAWLNIPEIDFIAASDAPRLQVPQVLDGKVQFHEIELPVGPGSILPITSVGGKRGKFSTGWPPESQSFKTISPESESALEYGHLQSVDEDSLKIATSAKTGTKALHVTLRWKKPVRDLIPPSAGLDVMYGQKLMRAVAERSSHNPEAALLAAKEHARKYVSEGTTSRELEWFLPILDRAGSKAVCFQATDFGFPSSDWSELINRSDFKAFLAEPVPIRRVWGPLGLFWALLLERLEADRSFNFCQSCGRVIEGKSHKRYCSDNDNPQCFAQRRAADKRRSREQRG